MKEESKYYTPEIEELHPNFEYEYLEKDSVIDKGKWVKRKFPFGGVDFSIDDLLKGDVRVKHLDREDIESLGWEHVRLDCVYKKEDLHLIHNGTSVEIVEHYDKDSCEYGGTCENGRFRGTIKNKSQLKQVLSWIM